MTAQRAYLGLFLMLGLLVCLSSPSKAERAVLDPFRIVNDEARVPKEVPDIDRPGLRAALAIARANFGRDCLNCRFREWREAGRPMVGDWLCLGASKDLGGDLAAAAGERGSGAS